MTTARARTVLAPLVLGVVVLLLWEGLVKGFDIKPFVLPSPSLIWEQVRLHTADIFESSLQTARNALIGLVLGTVAAVVCASIAAAWRVVDELTSWVVLATAVVPIVALAPVLYGMFGADLQTARVLIAAVASFIPIYVNTLRGLRTVRPIHLDLMRAYAATPRQVNRTVTLPGAVPFFLTGVRIASSLAVIAALIAEYFGGPTSGLGKSITTAVSSSAYPLAWSYVVGAIVTGLVFYLATLLLETLVLRRLRPG